jgi:hypothetical protein
MELQRYDPSAQLAHAQSLDPNVQALVRQMEAQGQQPIIVITQAAPVNEAAPRVVAAQPLRESAQNQHGLVFIVVMAILFVAVFAILVVSCHETPIVHETRNIPSCVAVC